MITLTTTAKTSDATKTELTQRGAIITNDLKIIAGSVRVLQVFLAITLLGIAGKLTVNTSTLKTFSTYLNELVADGLSINITDSESTVSVLSFGKFTKTQALTIATTAITLLSHFILSGAVKFTKLTGSGKTSTSTFTITNEENSSVPNLGNIKNNVYFYGLLVSEFCQLVLWFGDFVYQTAKYGNWNCLTVSDLLYQYNITDSTSSDDLDKLFGVTSLASATNITDDDVLNAAANTILTELYNATDGSIYFTAWNTTSEVTKQELFLELASDCAIKKASIAVSFVGLFGFFISTLLVVFSWRDLVNGLKNSSKPKDKTADDLTVDVSFKKEANAQSDSGKLTITRSNLQKLAKSVENGLHTSAAEGQKLLFSYAILAPQVVDVYSDDTKSNDTESEN